MQAGGRQVVTKGGNVRFFDFRQIDDNKIINADLCIIGSGPAGLSIARELAGTNFEVIVLESGGLDTESDTQSLYDIENIGVARQLDQKNVRLRIFGGTSHVWTGRCAPFDAVDFEKRSWVAHSGWPFTRAELEPYLERAGVYLGLGPHCYDDTLWQQFKVPQPKPSVDERFLEPMFWQFSKSPAVPKSSVDFARDLHFPKCDNITILLHANVISIAPSPCGTMVESVEISTLDRRRGCVRARAVVLACGGIENARLLLASNRIMPRGLGNEHDLVGRFLMDHPLCSLGHFDKEGAAKVRDRFGHYWLDDQRGRHTYLHGLTLGRDVQSKERLLRCDAFIEMSEFADDDPWQGIRRLASLLKSKRISRAAFRDCKLLLSHSPEIGRGLYRRMIKHRPELVRANRVELHCLLEQMPDPESRITLSADKRDSLGMPLSTINWKIGEVERQSSS